MKHVGEKFLILSLILLLAVSYGYVPKVQAASTDLSETEYQQRMMDVISVAEFFRADQNFIYEANCNLTAEQEMNPHAILKKQ